MKYDKYIIGMQSKSFLGELDEKFGNAMHGVCMYMI